MSTRIDKLFRNKLAEHSAAPSANAWARVEAGLSKKNNGLIWFRWAAVLLIPVLLAGILVLRRDGSGTNTLNTALNDSSKKTSGKKDDENKTQPPAETPKNNPGKNADAVKKTIRTLPLTNKTKTKTVTEEETRKPLQVLPNEAGTTLAKNENVPAISQPDTPAIIVAEKKDAEPNADVTPEGIASATKVKPIVLEYTLTSPEPEVPVEKGITLTVQLKEKKGFQKVIDFALDAKNSEGPLATLRQAKQDFFAFNFKKDKHPK